MDQPGSISYLEHSVHANNPVDYKKPQKSEPRSHSAIGAGVDIVES
jgi:hypothetical protein